MSIQNLRGVMEAFPFPPCPAETVLESFVYKWFAVDVGIFFPSKYEGLQVYFMDRNLAFNLSAACYC